MRNGARAYAGRRRKLWWRRVLAKVGDSAARYRVLIRRDTRAAVEVHVRHVRLVATQAAVVSFLTGAAAC